MNSAKIEWDEYNNTLIMTVDSKNYYLKPTDDGYFFGWNENVSCIKDENGNYFFVNENGQVTNYNQDGNVIENNIVYSEKVNNFLYGNYEYESENGSVISYKNGKFFSEKYSDGSVFFYGDEDNSYYFDYLNNNIYICGDNIVITDENNNYYLIDKDNKVVCYDKNLMPIENYNHEVVNQLLNEKFNVVCVIGDGALTRWHGTRSIK